MKNLTQISMCPCRVSNRGHFQIRCWNTNQYILTFGPVQELGSVFNPVQELGCFNPVQELGSVLMVYKN
jgi:hypothetical protein